MHFSYTYIIFFVNMKVNSLFWSYNLAERSTSPGPFSTRVTNRMEFFYCIEIRWCRYKQKNSIGKAKDTGLTVHFRFTTRNYITSATAPCVRGEIRILPERFRTCWICVFYFCKRHYSYTSEIVQKHALILH